MTGAPAGFRLDVGTESAEQPTDIADLEIEASRRSLRLLRDGLGIDGVRVLLAPLIEEADEQWRRWVASSDGYWPCAMQITVAGLTLSEFDEWKTAHFDALAMREGNPEHHALARVLRGTGATPDTEVIETIAGLVTRLVTGPLEPLQLHAFWDPAFDRHTESHGRLLDGTEVSRTLAEFREADGGFVFKQTKLWPKALPAELATAHHKHVVLEYARWCQMAVASRG